MKRKLFFVSASLIAGAVGSIVWHRQKNQQTEIPFVGKWFYQRNNRKVTVVVTPELEVFIQKKQQPVTIIEQTPTRLAFLDALGYRIIFEEKDGQFFFYDETEDKNFLLNKQ